MSTIEPKRIEAIASAFAHQVNGVMDNSVVG
jgi:hypothetical protein